MNKNEYKEIIAFHPGYYFADIIEELEMTQEEFAKRLDVSGKTVSLLLNGQTPLTNDLAMRISAMLGISVETLLNLQKVYDEKHIEIQMAKSLDEEIEVFHEIDYSYFTKNGFLKKADTKQEKIQNLRSFLMVSNLTVLRRRDLMVSFRKTTNDISDKHIINANVWLQTAINWAKLLPVEAFNEKQLKENIVEMRKMTKETPEVFLPKLKKMFGDCGVAFVVLPALKNSGVNGFVKWCDDRVVLALNDRFKSADTFWFSLFHEIKHIFQKKKTKIIVNPTKGLDDIMEIEKHFETEADQYARNVLIPEKEYIKYFEKRNNFISKREVMQFSEQIGIHPGIVVGRLQHDKKVRQTDMNDLKERYAVFGAIYC